MKRNILKILSIFVALGMLSLSCDKASDEPQVDLASSQDNIVSEKAVSEVFGIVNSLPTAKATGTCPTYAWSQKLLTITYPQAGCAGNDGITRSGVIKAQFSPNFAGAWAVNDYVTITFENYYVNGNKLTGTVVATCTQLQPKKIFRLTSENMGLTFSDTKTISWSMTMYYTMLAGGGTLDWNDDEWQIDGTNTGVGRNGKTFTRMATALKTSTTCKYFVAGNLELTINSSDTYNIEFKSTCGSIVITYRNIPFPINLE
jgi:hypothetical protein